MKIEIPRDVLRASVYTMGNADIRFYLNGAFIEASGNRVRVTATDGTVLSVQEYITPTEITEPVSIIVPRELVVLIKANKLVKNVTFEKTSDTWFLTDLATKARQIFVPIDSTFPDYLSIIPANVSGEVSQYDPRAIASFASAAKMLTGRPLKVSIGHNGDKPALVSIGLDAAYLGVMSASRDLSSALLTTVGHWVLSPIDETAACHAKN